LPWASSLLDGVNVAALGVSAVLLIQWRVNSAWRVLLGGVGNVVYQYLT